MGSKGQYYVFLVLYCNAVEQRLELSQIPGGVEKHHASISNKIQAVGWEKYPISKRLVSGVYIKVIGKMLDQQRWFTLAKKIRVYESYHDGK
jgi:hypothetical protein